MNRVQQLELDGVGQSARRTECARNARIGGVLRIVGVDHDTTYIPPGGRRPETAAEVGRRLAVNGVIHGTLMRTLVEAGVVLGRGSAESPEIMSYESPPHGTVPFDLEQVSAVEEPQQA